MSLWNLTSCDCAIALYYHSLKHIWIPGKSRHPRDALMWPCVKLHFPMSQLWRGTMKLMCNAAVNPVTPISDQPFIPTCHQQFGSGICGMCVYQIMYKIVIPDQKMVDGNLENKPFYLILDWSKVIHALVCHTAVTSEVCWDIFIDRKAHALNEKTT